MGLFKRAAARGVAHELVLQKLAAFPSKEAMDEAADAVADAHEAMPEVSEEGGHSPEHLAEVANKLMEISHALMEQAGAHGEKGASEISKFAASTDYADVAAASAVECMDKAAAEVKQAGGLIMGGDKGNDETQAAHHGEVAKLDLKNRPVGYAHEGMGKTKMETMSGHVGDLKVHDKKPGESPSGSNSLTQDAHKAAAYKIANKLVGLHNGKNENSPAEAAKYDTVGKLDLKNRPVGAYHVGQGNANIKEDAAARIGKEQPHPNGPSNSPSGSNSVVEASKVSEEDAFLTLFKKTASDVGPYLPPVMSQDEKVAAITRMIGYDHDQRQGYLNELYKASEENKMPAALKEHFEKKEKGEGHTGDHEKKETKAEEKMEHKKESSLLTRIREIAASAN